MANVLPTDANNVLYEGLRDPVGTQFVAKEAGAVLTDGGGVTYAPEVVNATAGASVALSSPPTTLTAGADTALTFATQARHLTVQNKSTSDVYIEFDATASLGSLVIPGGANALASFDLPCTVLHAYCAAALNVNGTAGANLVVKGWS